MKFHLTVDFPDDIQWAEGNWSEEKLRDTVRKLADKNIEALHWLDYPMYDGHWDRGGSFIGLNDNFDFKKAFTKEPLRIVCEEAKKHNMKVYSVIKPYDVFSDQRTSSIGLDETGREAKGIDQIGGMGRGSRWISEHPDMRMRLHPSLSTTGRDYGKIKTIRLWHESDEGIDIDGVEIWTSTRNGDFRLYTGNWQMQEETRLRKTPLYRTAPEKSKDVEKPCRCIEISGLDISDPYVGLVVKGGEKLTNTLHALLEVENEAGESVPFTYGLVPFPPEADNRLPHWETLGMKLDRDQDGFEVLDKPQLTDWQKWGFHFDSHSVIKSAGKGASKLESRVSLGGVPNFGFAVGKNEYLTGIVDLYHPEVRSWLMGMVEHAHDCGVDGVDIRFSSHTMSLDAVNYGYDPKAVEEYRSRKGVDVTKEAFDRQDWMDFKGEFVTEFMREASAFLHSWDKELLVHVSEALDGFAQCNYDIDGWVDNKYVDVLTYKGFDSNSEVYAKLKAGDIPFIVNKKPGNTGNYQEDTWLEILEVIEKENIETFNIYELANFTILDKDGNLNFHFNRFWEKVQKMVS